MAIVDHQTWLNALNKARETTFAYGFDPSWFVVDQLALTSGQNLEQMKRDYLAKYPGARDWSPEIKDAIANLRPDMFAADEGSLIMTPEGAKAYDDLVEKINRREQVQSVLTVGALAAAAFAAASFMAPATSGAAPISVAPTGASGESMDLFDLSWFDAAEPVGEGALDFGTIAEVPEVGGQIATIPEFSFEPVFDAGFEMGSSTIPDIVSATGGTNWGNVLTKLGTIAVSAWQKSGRPAAQNAQVRRLSNGSTQVVQKDGTIITTSANGRSSVTKIPVGQPYTFPDGAIVINNGNGTFTRQSPDGSIQNGNYPPTISGVGDSNVALYAGIGLLGLLLLTR